MKIWYSIYCELLYIQSYTYKSDYDCITDVHLKAELGA